MLKRWKTLSKSRKIFLLSYRRFIDDILVSAYKKTKYLKWMHKSNEPDHDGIFPHVLSGPNGEDIVNPLQLTGAPNQPSVNFLDITVEVNAKQNKFTWKLFDKRDGILVNGIKLSSWRNFPHVKTMLAHSCKYGVITSQLYRFNRRTSTARNFIRNAGKYIDKMVRNGYTRKRCVVKALKYMTNHWTLSLGKGKTNLVALKKELRKRAVAADRQAS